MIKFEVGKVYRRLDEEKTVVFVVSRGDFTINLRFIKLEDNYIVPPILGWSLSEKDGVEQVAGSRLILSADKLYCGETEEDEEPEANIEEVKEEDKEEKIKEDSDDWIVEDEYEAICLETKQRFKVKLIDIDKDTNYALMFASNIPSLILTDWFEDYKEVAIATACGTKCDKTIVIFKHGVEPILSYEEIKEERKPVCFEVGKEYKACSRDSDIWELKAAFDANDGKIGIFYNKRTNIFLRPVIKTLNSVEYTTYGNVPDELDFIADEQYRDEIQALL